MIAYVLVMIVSLQTGQTMQALLEGPMSKSWCEQLIQQDRYKGDDGKSRKLPTCLTGTDAQHTLAASSCTRAPGPSPRWPSIQYNCAPAPVQVAMVAGIQDAAVSDEVPDDSGVPPQVAAGRVASLPPREAVAVAKASLAVASPPPQAADVAPPVAAAVRPPMPVPPPAAAPLPPPPAQQEPQRQIHIGAAASALLGQAEKQAASGEHEAAAATLERALRIESENPLLWMELGRLRMAEGKAEPAEGFYRKALTLASGDAVVQARAWALLADALRARGHNQEAAAAQAHISVSGPN